MEEAAVVDIRELSKKEILDLKEKEDQVSKENKLFTDLFTSLTECINKKIKDNGDQMPLTVLFRVLNTLFVNLIQSSIATGKAQAAFNQFSVIAEALIRAEISAQIQSSPTPPAKTE